MYTDQGMYNASRFGTPEELQATITTHDLFRVLGVEPLVGATFPSTFDRTRNFGLVISHGLWDVALIAFGFGASVLPLCVLRRAPAGAPALS
jgi:hypothetical protein